MKSETKIFADPSILATAFADDFAMWVAGKKQDRITVALSGGSTPKMLFELWAKSYTDKLDWSKIHFFWGDERCVPPDDRDSNYGVANALFFEKVGIGRDKIHRVLGESDPASERARYEKEILDVVEVDGNRLPVFDLIILGMGDDGHTASIFPHESKFLHSDRMCEVAVHPQSGQKRITLTGPVINRAKKIVFLITGDSKANVLTQVINKSGDYKSFPASHIESEDLCFYMDQAAASQLS